MIHARMLDAAWEQIRCMAAAHSEELGDRYDVRVRERIPDSRLDFSKAEQDAEDCVLNDLADLTQSWGPWDAARSLFNPINEGDRP